MDVKGVEEAGISLHRDGRQNEQGNAEPEIR